MGQSCQVVTGGAGFIGSHLVRALLAEGHRVRVVDDLSSGARENLPAGTEFLEGDVVRLARRAVDGASVVYHLAAMVSVPRSMQNPRASHRATADSTLALLEAAQAARVPRLVFASSAAVYGDAPLQPKREDQPPEPKSPYAVAKLCSELYASHWARQGVVETVGLRFFNVYGPGQDPASPYAAAIPIFVAALLEGRPVPVFGDGRQTRDFTYVGDIIQGLRAAASAVGVSGKVYNLATGRPVSVLDLIRTLAAVMGVTPTIEFKPARPGDILHSSADIFAARQDLGYRPRTPLEAGLRATVEWFRTAGSSSAAAAEGRALDAGA